MFGNPQLYEIYRHPNKPDEEATRLVRQGFSIWAFLFHFVWLFYHRLWLPGAVFMLLYLGTIYLGMRLGLSDVAVGAMQLALQVWLGINAADIRAANYERKGFIFEDVSSGANTLEAERRYHYTHEAHL